MKEQTFGGVVASAPLFKEKPQLVTFGQFIDAVLKDARK